MQIYQHQWPPSSNQVKMYVMRKITDMLAKIYIKEENTEIKMKMYVKGKKIRNAGQNIHREKSTNLNI